MSLTQIITDSLRKNIVNGAGFFRSPDGIFEVTYLPDEGKGYIDIINPKNQYKFLDLKSKAMQYLKALPKGKWEFNPDTAQKGKIYGQRIFKGMPGVKPNPNMPNKALTYDNRVTTQGTRNNNAVMKIIKNKPIPNLKIIKGKGGFGTDFDYKNTKPSDRPSETGMPRFNLPGKIRTPDGMVWPLV